MNDPYLVLGIPESASDERIREAYLEGIRAFPPERAPDRFQRITEAYHVIRDDVSRARLRVFGAPRLKPDSRLADLVPRPESRRKRVGMDVWLQANRDES
jgi:curved DNA-binding protein CbpA